jgi:hypothetical protein
MVPVPTIYRINIHSGSEIICPNTHDNMAEHKNADDIEF